MPTREYMILENTAVSPPKIAATRSKPKRPIKSQFNAPTITSVNANTFIYDLLCFAEDSICSFLYKYVWDFG